jgi:hypothetical protein
MRRQTREKTGLTSLKWDYQPPGGHASLAVANHLMSLLSHLGHLISFSSEGPRGAFTRNLLPHCWQKYSHGGGPDFKLQAISSWISSLEHRGHLASSGLCGPSKSNTSWHWLQKYFFASISYLNYTTDYKLEKYLRMLSRGWQTSYTLLSQGKG